MENNLITIHKTRPGAKLVATVMNNSENPVLIIFRSNALKRLHVAPDTWIGIPADDEGRAMLEAFERDEYNILLLDPLYAILVKTAENYGWSVKEDDDGGIDFCQHSPAGEDFGFYIHPADDIVQAVVDYSLDFDELVEDAAAIHQMLDDLAGALLIAKATGKPHHPSMIEEAEPTETTSTKVVVVVEGGMVSEVYTGGADIDLVIIDKDTDTKTKDDQEDLAGLVKIY